MSIRVGATRLWRGKACGVTHVNHLKGTVDLYIPSDGMPALDVPIDELSSFGEHYFPDEFGSLWYEDETKETKMKETTMTLYQFSGKDGEIKYGSYLATNSSGQYVMEEKGTGTIITADKSTVEEVLPYTVDIRFLSSGDKTYSYFAEAGEFEAGGFYMLENHNGVSVVQVAATDTKRKNATKDFKPLAKLCVEKLDT